ncbi:hypothetical protein ACFFX1_03415 [Dactylosporangium sucinum]|uniref:Uncharacterized protein n=1 Tax=Dactylosporangium sucinum TaxID=1424081 RepID=A0A917WMW9_9ACTN|nr:hypothetical protein [Dactylosporangium sucinum]GGM16015.1 hypothetical protein GCM10007977_016580 [Dactylosporangium sucinum]
MTDELTDELTEAVRGAARAVPPNAPDLEGVLRRHKRRRRRHALSAAAAALAVLLAGAAVVLREPAPTNPTLDPSPSPVTSTAAAAPGFQRLNLDFRSAQIAGDKTRSVGVQQPPGLLELAPDGRTILSVPLPDVVDDARNHILLPDGRTVLLGSKDLKPGTKRTDGVDVTDLEIRLVVLSPAGAVTLSRNVRIQGQDVGLVGATATEAYLSRPAGIVRHDLATGAEQPLSGAPADTFMIESGLALTLDVTTCQLGVHALATDILMTTLHLPTSSCGTFHQVRISPDGRLLATATWDPFSAAVPSVAVCRLADSRAAVYELAGRAGDPPGVLGLAWSGSTLRVAQAVLPPDANRMYPLAEVLKTRDIETGF